MKIFVKIILSFFIFLISMLLFLFFIYPCYNTQILKMMNSFPHNISQMDRVGSDMELLNKSISLIKRHFSFSVFIFSQIMIDIETLKNILSGSVRLHTFFHTFIGATLLIPILSIIGKYVFQFLSSKFSQIHEVSWKMSFVSASIGTYSHVLLDAVMHRDLVPFAPFSASNPFLGLISVNVLHKFCLLTGAASFIVFIFFSIKKCRGAESFVRSGRENP